MSSSMAVDPSQVVSDFSKDVIINYISIAYVALLAYDSVLLMDKEIKYFLRKPQSLISWLYYANRYSAILNACLCASFIVAHVNTEFCQLVSYLGTILKSITVLSTDYILLLRVQALYTRGRKMTTFLWIAFIIDMLIFAGFNLAMSSLNKVRAYEVVEGTFACFKAFDSVIMESMPWIIFLVYGTLLTLLVAFKSFFIRRESGGLSGQGFVKILVRDQTVYFAAVILFGVINIISGVLDVTPAASFTLEAMGNPGLLSVLSCRLLINMKEVGEKGASGGTSFRPKTMSEMDFDGRATGGAVESSQVDEA